MQYTKLQNILRKTDTFFNIEVSDHYSEPEYVSGVEWLKIRLIERSDTPSPFQPLR